jgi:hypothetical protein
VEGEAYDILDILAITFILKSMDDTLKLVHALQKRGVILQENTVSRSITQTLFESPQSMREAVRRLMVSLAQSGGSHEMPGEEELLANATTFYEALSVNAAGNLYSLLDIGSSSARSPSPADPPHADTNEIMIPGTPYRYEGLGQQEDPTTHLGGGAAHIRRTELAHLRTEGRLPPRCLQVPPACLGDEQGLFQQVQNI